MRVKRQLEAERLRRIMPQGVPLFKSLRRELQCLTKDSLGVDGLNKGKNRRLFCRIMWRAAILEVMMMRRKRTNATQRYVPTASQHPALAVLDHTEHTNVAAHQSCHGLGVQCGGQRDGAWQGQHQAHEAHWCVVCVGGGRACACACVCVCVCGPAAHS